MKAMFLSVAGLGAGGAAFYGSMDSPDFDRTVNRSPAAVYAAFSDVLPAGTISEPGVEGLPAATLRIAKKDGRSITYARLFDDRAALTAEFDFAPAGASGEATRMTAEVDVDISALPAMMETEGGIALSVLPDRIVDEHFADWLDDMVDEVEAGRPLVRPSADSLGLRRRDSADVDERRMEARRTQRQAAQPMARATPMVDPNAAARAHREGRPDPNQYRTAP